MDATLFNSGFRPAIDLGLSVSRIGNKVQSPAMRRLSAMLRLEYVQYNELLKKTRFTAGVSEEVAARLRPGEVLTQLFTQDPNEPYSLVKEVLMLYALRRKTLEDLDSTEIEKFKTDFIDFAKRQEPDALKTLTEGKELTPELRRTIDACMKTFVDEF
jgi:F-type H+-transporting ATPase subunit alpha